ncbi:MAG: hypothetical protein ACRBN8_23870 [Nannocystales bacterium]
MKRLGLLAIAVALGCNATSDGDTDTDGNSGGGSGDTDNLPTGTDTVTASDSANTDTASGSASSGTSSSGTTDATSAESSSSTGTATDESTSSTGSTGAESSSTGAPGPQALCESTDGTWDPTACGDYYCGIPNDCEALDPGCDCGPDANFVDGEGCVADDACTTFDCGNELQCVTVAQYCLATFPGVKGAPIIYECLGMPAECSDSIDCMCLTTALEIPPPAFCEEPAPGGLLVQVFQP